MRGPNNFVKKHADQIIVCSSLFALLTWVLFVFGFGMESNNPDRLPNWQKDIEKFTSYVFCFVGLGAIVLVIMNTMYKKPIYLGTSLLLTALSMLFAGGPLDETGHYIWDCRSNDYEGKGCQEETYSNMSMMFSSLMLYAFFMSIVVYTTTYAPTTSRFTLKGSGGLDAGLV